jgi:predicted transposase YbfD/YdcC
MDRAGGGWLCRTTRIIGDKTSVESRYSLCSFTELEQFAQRVRQHWRIENQQHWVLDVQFGEDRNQTRKDHAPKNLALIRRVALNLLNNNKTGKDSLRCRKLHACLNDSYREELIFGKKAT